MGAKERSQALRVSAVDSVRQGAGTTPTVVLAGCHFEAGRGGICRVARLMARACIDAGWQVAALDLLDAEPPADLGIPIALFRGNRIAFAWACHRAALAGSFLLYDHLGTARAHPRLPGLKRPHAVWIHGIEVWEGARADRLAVARRADLLLCNTEHTKRRALDLFGEPFDRAQVCWLATEEYEPPSEPARFDGPPTVLILGRVDEGRYKGHRELIECWPRVLSVVPDAWLLAVGGGTGLDAVSTEAARSTVAGKIEVLGFVPEEHIEPIWRRAHALAMPSRGEGFGLVYIEAMRRGLPVIASVHDAAPEVNLDGVTGYNVNLDKPDELPDRIIRLLRDPNHAAAMGRAGQARWAEHFRYSAFRRRFQKVIDPLLQAP
ncbi:conserved hypothetical protein [uncultured Defluviicoccus sp.]|uniref:Glycosyl transferase family 1 domain-containing protein n=1 Tax=metagenome TaxID=256318 RepID=A0A380TLK9_9ZZZZ|nr:conserved hypothetical protein [uncultured Defluviicoccus sp.]